jgi:6-bladed beta-propeller protein
MSLPSLALRPVATVAAGGALVVSGLVGACATNDNAQRLIPDRIVCSECGIERRHLVTLSDPPDSTFIGGTWAPALAQDSRGRFYLVHAVHDVIAVFDAAGTFLRTIGRSGEAPGEYRHISQIIAGPGDTLYVYDFVLRRETVLAPSYRLARVRNLARAGALVRMAGGELVMNVLPGGPQYVGPVIQVIDSTGAIVRGFGGGDSALSLSGHSAALGRALLPVDANRVYVGRRAEYVIELWDVGGVKLNQWSRRADWFEPWRLAEPVSARKPPPPSLYALHAQSDSVLLVLISIPDPHFENAITEGGPHGLRFEDPNRYFDTMVEALDLRSGRLLSRQRFDDHSYVFFGDGLTFTVPEGEPRLQIWKLQLDRPR